MDTLGRVSAFFDKGDNFCDFLFAFLLDGSLFKMEAKPTVTELSPVKVLVYQFPII